MIKFNEWIKSKITFPIQISCYDNGKKRLSYPYKWETGDPTQFKFPNNFSPNGKAILTGEINDIVVIDIDDVSMVNEIRSKTGFDLNTASIIIATKKGFHYYFKYTDRIKTTTNYKGLKGVDIRADGGNVVYQVDKVKCADYKLIKFFPKLTEIHESFLFYSPSKISKDEIREKQSQGYPLKYLIDELLGLEFDGNRMLNLTSKAEKALRRITPNIFRFGEMGEEYRKIFEKKGYIEPNDIAQGDGSTYLSRVAAILSADETIDLTTMEAVLKKLNRLWAEPMDERRLMQTVFKNGHIKIEGEDIFKYNPNWEKDYKVKEETGLKVWIEPVMEKWCIYDDITKKLYINSKMAFQQIYKSLTGSEYTNWVNLPIIQITYDPNNERFFKKDGVKYFNTFQSTPYLDLAKKREKPKQKPKIILKIIENLIPEDEKRELFLKWLGYWWSTREKSLVSWVFTSPQGAGKGLLTDLIIGTVVGEHNCSLEVGEDLLESQFTNWLKDKLFISFNEINTLTKDRYKNRNKIKRLITGTTFQLRQMGVGAYDYPNFANFIFSTNDAVPVDIEESDRRFNVCVAKKPLKEYKWFQEIVKEGAHKIKEIILSELPDFVRYVSTLDINENDYHRVIDDEAKRAIIEDNKSPLDEFTEALKNKDVEYFDIALMDETVKAKIIDGFKVGFIPTQTAFEAFELIAPYIKITKTKLSRAIKRAGIEIKLKNINGKIVRAYEIGYMSADSYKQIEIEHQDKNGFIEKKEVVTEPIQDDKDFSKLSHEEIREELINYLIERGLKREDFKKFAEIAETVGFNIKQKEGKIKLFQDNNIDKVIAVFHEQNIIGDEVQF